MFSSKYDKKNILRYIVFLKVIQNIMQNVEKQVKK